MGLRPWLAGLALTALSGCSLISDGGEGDLGLVRFSLVLDYAQSTDFTSPVAVGRTVFVALQHPKEGLLDDETFTELTLRVEDPSGTPVESIFPLGFGQFGMVLAERGRHRMIAVQKDGTMLDSLGFDVEEVDDIEVDDRARVVTSYNDGTDICTDLAEMSLGNVVLHRNQTLEIFVVPRSKTGQPMLGLLGLTADGPASVQLHSPLVGQGRNANALIVKPETEMADTVDLVIRDSESDDRLEVSIPASNEDKVLDCSS